jgi:Predicted membrane protein (DUF2254)
MTRRAGVRASTSIGWSGAVVSGLALVAVALMMATVFGSFDALHYSSVADFFLPDPTSAAGTLGLVGGAEGVTLSIVLICVMFGIQTSSSRYSPRIIDIFTHNPLNALVLSFALASILYTFLIRGEVKVNYVPLTSVIAAECLAIVNFAILFPYVVYTFEIMRAETLVGGILRRARKELRAGTRQRHDIRHRNALLLCIEQLTDIVFGSLQHADMPVCVRSIEDVGEFVVREYFPVKKNLNPEWLKVGHAELPGASDQVVAEVNRAGTWFSYTILSSFVDMVGLTPTHRSEVVQAIAVATRKIGLAAIDVGDPEVAELCVRFFNTYLRSAINCSAPAFASVIMNEYRRFAIGALEWRRDLSVESAAYLLRYGRHFDEAGMPAIFGAAAEDVADLAIEARVRDPQVSFRLAQLLVRNLLELIPNARPIGLNGLFKGVAKLTCWAMASGEKDIAHVLVEGIAAAPPDFVEAALVRMETLQQGLFWEVNERVVSFDWLERPLRDEIPRLRAAVRRASGAGDGAAVDLEGALEVAADLVPAEAPARVGPAAAASPAG